MLNREKKIYEHFEYQYEIITIFSIESCTKSYQ